MLIDMAQFLIKWSPPSLMIKGWNAMVDGVVKLWDFVKDVKHSGTRGEGLGSSTFLGKYAIREMERTYIEKFGSIVATHHVYFCKAKI